MPIVQYPSHVAGPSLPTGFDFSEITKTTPEPSLT